MTTPILDAAREAKRSVIRRSGFPFRPEDRFRMYIHRDGVPALAAERDALIGPPNGAGFQTSHLDLPFDLRCVVDSKRCKRNQVIVRGLTDGARVIEESRTYNAG